MMMMSIGTTDDDVNDDDFNVDVFNDDVFNDVKYVIFLNMIYYKLLFNFKHMTLIH